TSGTFAIDILATCNSFTAKLEGQSAGSSLWGVSSNLSGWHEQEFVPARVRLCSGGAVSNKTITIDFDHQKTSALELLTDLGWVDINGFHPGVFVPIPSAGIFITPVPPLSPSGVGGDTWTYTFKVAIDANAPGFAGYVEFRALMASGAHRSTGGSLHISGGSGSNNLGTLQILLPAPGTGIPDLEVHKFGP